MSFATRNGTEKRLPNLDNFHHLHERVAGLQATEGYNPGVGGHPVGRGGVCGGDLLPTAGKHGYWAGRL